jgi:hypothetical protein
MKPIPFDPHKDLAPMVFDPRICEMALEIKRLGISWRPHVGCFVWDPEKIINTDSPFPHRIYFILSMPRFLDIFGTVKEMVTRLVWLPTWHQARMLCKQLGVPDEDVTQIWQSQLMSSAGDELQEIYALLIDTLKKEQVGDS